MKNQKNVKVFELMETKTGNVYSIYLHEEHARRDVELMQIWLKNRSGLIFDKIFPLHVHERQRTVEYVVANIVDVVVD